jgi:hypothetical protein
VEDVSKLRQQLAVLHALYFNADDGDGPGSAAAGVGDSGDGGGVCRRGLSPVWLRAAVPSGALCGRACVGRMGILPPPSQPNFFSAAFECVLLPKRGGSVPLSPQSVRPLCALLCVQRG